MGFNDCYNRLKEMTISEEKIENENRFKKTVLIVYNRCKRMVETILEDDGSRSSVAISTGFNTLQGVKPLGGLFSLRASRRGHTEARRLGGLVAFRLGGMEAWSVRQAIGE